MASPPFYWDLSFGLVAINCADRIEWQNEEQEDADRVVQILLIRHHILRPLWRRDSSQAMRSWSGRRQRVFLRRSICRMWHMVVSVERIVSVAQSEAQSALSIAENTAESVAESTAAVIVVVDR